MKKNEKMMCVYLKAKKDVSMGHYICFIILALCSLTFLFSSCDAKEIPSGGKVIVNFSLSNISYNGNEIITRSFGDAEPETVVVHIEEDLYMYASLEAAPISPTRDSATNHNPGKLRIVAYLNDGISYRTHADYAVTNTGELSPIDAPLQVEPGNYKFAAYSYNNEQTSLPSPFTHEILNINPENDLLWGSASASIVSSNSNVVIKMEHKLSQLKIEATTTAGTITNISDVFAVPGYEIGKFTVHSGQITKGNSCQQLFPSWSTLNQVTVTSEARTVYPHGESITAIHIGTITINGKTHQNLNVGFAKSLQPKISYTLKINFKKDDAPAGSFAGSNIYWDGSKLTFDPAVVKDRENLQGVFFKWGSLVGLSPKQELLTTLTVYIPNYDSANPGASAWTVTNFKSAYGNQWKDHTDWLEVSVLPDDVRNTYLIDMERNTDAYYTARTGDICQYLGKIGAAPRGYRMPTAREFADVDIANPEVAAKWYPHTADVDVLDGWRYKGPVYSWVDVTTSSLANGQYKGIFGAGMYKGKTEFPASGHRHHLYGDVEKVGLAGQYWSASGHGSPSYSRMLDFDVTNGIRPHGHVASTMGATIRCIKK